MENQLDSSVTTEVVNSVAEQTSFFMKFWHDINWNSILATGIAKAIQIIFFLIVLSILEKLSH